MQLQQRHIDALNTAETLMYHFEFCPYFELKALLHDTSPHARARFRALFTTFYALRVARLPKEFHDRFFDMLFSGEFIVNGQPDFPMILNELNLELAKSGKTTMQFSFVSKLVSIYRESSPIYDQHVLRFFGRTAPEASKPNAQRIAWFVGFLNQVAADYTEWTQDERFSPILDRFRSRDQKLAQCNDIRLVDFLVWKVGKDKLLSGT